MSRAGLPTDNPSRVICVWRLGQRISPCRFLLPPPRRLSADSAATEVTKDGATYVRASVQNLHEEGVRERVTRNADLTDATGVWWLGGCTRLIQEPAANPAAADCTNPAAR